MMASTSSASSVKLLSDILKEIDQQDDEQGRRKFAFGNPELCNAVRQVEDPALLTDLVQPHQEIVENTIKDNNPLPSETKATGSPLLSPTVLISHSASLSWNGQHVDEIVALIRAAGVARNKPLLRTALTQVDSSLVAPLIIKQIMLTLKKVPLFTDDELISLIPTLPPYQQTLFLHQLMSKRRQVVMTGILPALSTSVFATMRNWSADDCISRYLHGCTLAFIQTHLPRLMASTEELHLDWIQLVKRDDDKCRFVMKLWDDELRTAYEIDRKHEIIFLQQHGALPQTDEDKKDQAELATIIGSGFFNYKIDDVWHKWMHHRNLLDTLLGPANQSITLLKMLLRYSARLNTDQWLLCKTVIHRQCLPEMPLSSALDDELFTIQQSVRKQCKGRVIDTHVYISYYLCLLL